MKNLEILDEREDAKRLYNKKMVLLGAFLSGPLAGGYLMIENYRMLDKSQKVVGTLGWSIGATLLLVSLKVFFPDEWNVPHSFYSFSSLGLVWGVFRTAQQKEVEQFLIDGGEVQSNWGVARAVVVSFLVVLGTTITLVYLKPAAIPIQVVEQPLVEVPISEERIRTRSFGLNDHTIAYQTGQISGVVVEEIAERLIAINFFGGSPKKDIYLEIEEGRYCFYIQDESADPSREGTVQRYRALATSLAPVVPAELTIFLVGDDFKTILLEI